VNADLAALANVLSGLPEASIVESDDMVSYAVELAVRGWRIFPLVGKVPAVPNPHPKGSVQRATCKGECGRSGHGVLDATSDLEQIEMWWSGSYRGANIGARVPENVFVFDVDPRGGGTESLTALVTTYGVLAETMTVASGRGDGGTHRYYRAPDAQLTSKRLGAGIDIKTSAGYCVVPPSIHPDSGQAYVWAVEAEIADPPGWLVDLVTVLPPPIQVATMKTSSTSVWSRFSTSIADDYAEHTTWADVLEPHGWRCLDPDGDRDGARWLHPTATSSCSATVRHGCLFVYSPNTPFDQTETGDPHGLTRFRAHAVLDHNGDLSAAARALRTTGAL